MDTSFKVDVFNFKQDKLLEFNLSLNDALLLDWFSKFQSTNKMQAMIKDGKVLYWLSYAKVINDIPLAFVSEATLKRRLNHMIEKGILIKHYDKENQKVFLGMGEKYLELLYWNENVTETPEIIKEVKEKTTKSTNENIEDFEWFWDIYDKKVGKDKCCTKFLKLKKSDIAKIKETLPEYIKSTPDKKYRKNPLTYLNGSCWNDELVKVTIPKKIVKPQGIDYIPNQRRFTDEDD